MLLLLSKHITLIFLMFDNLLTCLSSNNGCFCCVVDVVCLGVCGESLTPDSMDTQGLECFHAGQLWSKYKEPWPTFRKELEWVWADVHVCVCGVRETRSYTHVPELLFFPYVFCIAQWLHNSQIIHPTRCSHVADIDISWTAVSFD